MTETPTFISWTFDPEVNGDRADALLGMILFIRDGLRDLGGPPKDYAGFSDFENFVKAAIFERCNSPFARPVPKRLRNKPGDTVAIIVDTFKTTQKWAAFDAPAAGFKCGRFTDEVAEALNAVWHPEGVDEMDRGSLQLAFDVAYSNFARASTRITLMHVIPELLRLPSAVVPACWHTIRQELWTRKLGCQRDLLLFGGLLGGAAFRTAIQTVAKQTCYDKDNDINFGLVHYLQRDNVSPGHWMSSFEDGLREDIEAAYERVMAC